VISSLPVHHVFQHTATFFLCVVLLLCPVSTARAVGEKASSTGVRILAELAGTRGVQRYRSLAAAGAKLDATTLSELIAADLEGGVNDPVERALLAGLLHRRLTLPEGTAAPAIAAGGLESGFIPRLAGDQDWRVRLVVAELLGDFGTELTLASHRILVQDPVWPVRLRAITALAALPPGENVRILEVILKRRDEATIPERIEATRALARMGQVPGLLVGLADPHTEVQLNAIWGLARRRSLSPEALQALERTGRETAIPRVREEIGLILQRPSPPPPRRNP